AVAAGSMLEIIAQVILGSGREFAVSGIGEPYASRNIRSWPVAPDRPRRQIGWSRCARHHIDKNGGLISPKRFRLRCRDDARTGKSCRSGCTIIMGAIAGGFRRSVLAANTDASKR